MAPPDGPPTSKATALSAFGGLLVSFLPAGKTMLATVTLATTEGVVGRGRVDPRHGRGRRSRHRRRRPSRARLPERTIKIGAAVSFVVFGLLLIIQGVR